MSLHAKLVTAKDTYTKFGRHILRIATAIDLIVDSVKTLWDEAKNGRQK